MEKKFCRLKVDEDGIEDAISIQLSTTKMVELRLNDGDIVVLKAIRKTKTMCVVYKNDSVNSDHVRINKAILTILRIHVGDTVVLTIPTRNDTTHLMDAASRGLLPIVQYLVQKRGMDVNERAPNGITPLCAASLDCNYDVMKFLVNSGSKKDYTMNTLKWLPIHWAAVSDDISAMKQLLDEDTNVAVDVIADDCWTGPNAYDGWTRPNTIQGPITLGQGNIGGGRTALHFASANNHVEMVKLLLKSKADSNHADCIGWTPLYRAAAKGHLHVVECLVQHPGTDINLANHMGFYPLVTAAAGGHFDVLKFLVDNKAELNTPTKNGWYPINLAITYGFFDMVRYLEGGGADLHTPPAADGFTNILYAAFGCHVEILKYLVGLEFSPNVTTVRDLISHSVPFPLFPSQKLSIIPILTFPTMINP